MNPKKIHDLHRDTKRKHIERELEASAGRLPAGAAVGAFDGVASGDLGAPSLVHLTAKIGAYSGASLGSFGGEDDQPAEGPMPAPR